MANIIEEIFKRLQRVNHIIASRTNVSDITFADACVIAQFYHDYQNTNGIIDDVENLARQDGKSLYESAIGLKKEVDKFVSLDLSVWNALDFINMEQSHLKEYKERWDVAKNKATNLWREYQTESNRLDMMDLNSEEFKTLDAQCDNIKLAYDEAHRQGEELYGIYRQEQLKCGQVHYFEMQFLDLLIRKISTLVDVILKNGEHLEKDMIDNSLILKEIAQLRDIVNLGVCVGVYQSCNGKQFKHMPASDFINFLNLKLDKAKVHPLPRQKQRICYMLFAVSHTIALSDSPKHWIESMLELCDISPEYYDKHHKDFLSVGVSEKNKEYKEIIDESIKRSY